MRKSVAFLGFLAAVLLGPVQALADDDLGSLSVGGGGGGTTTFTTSTTRGTTFTRVDLANLDASATRVAVVLNAQVVFDQTIGEAPGSAAAQSLLNQAAVALAGACSPMGPFTSNADVVGPSGHIGDVFNHEEFSVTTSTSLGPGTIFIGVDQSTPFFVAAGTTNINTNTHTESFFDQQFQATVTHQTDLVFTAQSCRPPDAPTNVTANLGSIVVSWTPPANVGDGPITGYVITESPSGATYTVGASSTTFTIDDPAPGTYTFTVRAVNAHGSSAESARSNPVTVAAVGGAATPVLATPRFAG